MELPTIEQMLEAGLHFGHQTQRWNPKMKPYIFGERNGIHIVDLRKSQQLLKESLDAVERLASEGKKVLFVGTKRQAKDVIKREAERIGMPYVTERWLGGTITNFATIRHSMARLEELEKLEQEGVGRTVTKKEMQKLIKERAKLEKVLAGLRHMTALPGLVYIIDCKKERIAVSEAVKLGIPVMAIVDTNVDPDPIDFPIPGNDDAMKSVRLVTRLVAKAVEQGIGAFNERKAVEEKAEPPAKEAASEEHKEPTKDRPPRRQRPHEQGQGQRRPREREGERPRSGATDRRPRESRGPRERRPAQKKPSPAPAAASQTAAHEPKEASE